MDAKEFFKEATRMCKTHYCYNDCPGYEICSKYGKKSQEMIDIVEKWSKENPIITNAMKFEEIFGFKLYPCATGTLSTFKFNTGKEALEWLKEEYKEK